MAIFVMLMFKITNIYPSNLLLSCCYHMGYHHALFVPSSEHNMAILSAFGIVTIMRQGVEQP